MEGTTKQVEWAEKIKDSVLKRIEEIIPIYIKHGWAGKAEVLQIGLKHLENYKQAQEAEWWINKKDFKPAHWESLIENLVPLREREAIYKQHKEVHIF